MTWAHGSAAQEGTMMFRIQEAKFKLHRAEVNAKMHK